jgi:pyruvate dehydrogenase E2 component (dihydrolipoamide acetyltransferase)
MAVRQFLLPDLGEGLEDAEVVSWRVAPGDTVALNQMLVEVNTAKALVEIPSPWAGVVDTLHAEEGEVVQVGSPLVSLRVDADEGSAPPTPAAVPTPVEEAASAAAATPSARGEEPATHEVPSDDQEEEPAAEDKPKRRAILVGYGVAEDEEPFKVGGPGERGLRSGPVPASPPVRRLAKELGIDLAFVTGTAPGGRVTREDVLAAAGRAGLTAQTEGGREEDVARIAVRGTRRLVAEHIALAAREIPMVTTFLTVDATNLQALREDIARHEDERVSPLPIVVRALVETCRKYPELNASFDARASEILLHRRIHVGIATDTDRGLLVTVVREADGLGILDLSSQIARLSEAARAGKIGPHELTGSTITVSNVGSFGAEYGTPIINHPEAAILALGVIEPRALVVEGRVEAREAVTLSLTFDHRVLDGAEAGRALKDLGSLLESPFRLGALPRRSPE